MFKLFKMNFKAVIFLFLIVLTLILASSLSFAQVSSTHLTSSGSDSITSVVTKNHTLSNGGLTNDNLSVSYSTDHWAAFYGNVSGNIILGDSSLDVFHSWVVTNFTDAVIYASTSPISDWSSANIEPSTYSHQSKFFFSGKNDNSTNTFNETETFTSPSLTKPNTFFSRTMQNGVEGNFKTYSLFAIAENDFIWAVKVREDDSSFIPGQSVDYQLLVPAQDSMTYNFYMELY